MKLDGNSIDVIDVNDKNTMAIEVNKLIILFILMKQQY